MYALPSPGRGPTRERRCLLRYDVDRVGCGLLAEIKTDSGGEDISENDEDRLLVLDCEYEAFGEGLGGV